MRRAAGPGEPAAGACPAVVDVLAERAGGRGAESVHCGGGLGGAGRAGQGGCRQPAPGSYLVLSHVTSDPDPQLAATGAAVYARTANPVRLRTRAEILAFFDGLEILEPGLVSVPQWRPDEPGPAGLGKAWMLGGVGRKPA